MTDVPQKRAPAAPVFAGVDVGATKIEMVLTGRELTTLAQARAQTPSRGGPRAVTATIVTSLEALLESANVGALTALGVGVPGQVNSVTGEVSRSPNIPGWRASFPLAAELSSRLSAPVAVDNDVRAALIGERRLGAARPYSQVLAIWFGTGVGGALLLDGAVRHGRLGAAGEIGHAVAVPGGRRCGCGRRGCLEAYAGRASMEKRAHERVEKGEKTALFTIMKKAGRARLTSGVIARALDEGDPLANELINEAVHAAGPVIASAVNVLDVEAVIIGGGLGSRLGQPFARRLSRAMQPHLLHDGRQSAAVMTAELGDLSGALGGAVLAAEPKTRAIN